MGTLAFLSRHEPTDRQRELAREHGFEDLVHVGDVDGFHDDLDALLADAAGHPFAAVAVVHAAAAVRLYSTGWRVALFENANRAPVGERPQFEATALHLY